MRVASERIELALYERALALEAGEGADSVWDQEELPLLPPMTFEQASMLLHLARRREALGDHWGRLAARKRVGPPSSVEIGIERRIWWEREQRRLRGDHYEETGNWFLPGEEVADVLAPQRRRAGKKGG